jgi:hypothetical protein
LPFFLGKSQGITYLVVMIQLTQGETEFIYLTLTEKQTIASPNYLFRFVNRTTRDEVAFVLLFALDVSIYKDRYNKFSIKVPKYFGLGNIGEWLYYVYEQTSAYNVDYTQATGLLEEGIMKLSPSTTFEYTQHEVDNTYITR